MEYTVIIPVYNGEETIFSCLTSATKQNGAILNKDYCVLVIDDGSNDRTVEIAKQFPIKILELGSNQGRIVARRTGAKNASTSRLLFLDSRVSIPPDTIIKLKSFSHLPAVMGINRAKSSKYRSLYDTIFYLIRRRYYGKTYFPQHDELVTITPDNFQRAPKGTTLLLIDKTIFLDIIPERTDKTVNDDTLLFHNLVFKKKIPLVCAKDLLFDYSQRTDLKSVIPWLFERGIRFADFYLRPGGYFFTIFLFTIIGSIGLAAGATVCIIYIPDIIKFILTGLFVLFLSIIVYLSESPKDAVIAAFMLPFIVTIFGAGILKFYLMKITRFFHVKKIFSLSA